MRSDDGSLIAPASAVHSTSAQIIDRTRSLICSPDGRKLYFIGPMNYIRADFFMTDAGRGTARLMNAIISGLFSVFAVRSGAYPFLFFTGMVVLQFIVVFFCYPATKEFSLEQLQNELGIV